MDHPIFIALDFATADLARQFLKKFEHAQPKPAIKIGMELFYTTGPDFVRELRQAGFTIFLDLKLYDIPNTVAQAVRTITRLDVQYLTLHAMGGAKMLEAAVAAKQNSDLKLLAVTQLTSLTEVEMQSTQSTTLTMTQSVKHLAELAYQQGIDGTISSALEATPILQVTAPEFLRITPGIRLAGDSADDQKRITTPSQARELAASGLVIGRSITKAQDPVTAYMRAKKEWSE
ncbi:orotidine-5'-phosphate decarboxylase [Leuconostoc fallax]|uniref:orotidine-5'-phosphate decarboxylase n=1 Tax=Leuconostoc fallax TaxID=1251 RepID=UPI0020906114|nr:orotidine-5'-phosphate decarboxylase [Leuconostoc fallax]MCO6183861.1 orotidine-5'-phosphate decarboxylase [Leuconostoc fallax]